MSKAKIYGIKGTGPKTGKDADRHWHRMTRRQRQRERAERNPVADKIAKEKEAQP